MPDPYDPEVTAPKLTICQRLDQLNKYHAQLAEHFAADHKKAARHLDFLQTIQNAKDKLCRKVKEDPKVAPPTFQEVALFGSEIGLPDAESRKFFHHFESNGWKISGREKVKNWRERMKFWRERHLEHERQKPSRGGVKKSDFEKGF